MGHLISYLGEVLFIHLFQRLEGMPRVGATPQGALMADAAAACPAVHC